MPPRSTETIRLPVPAGGHLAGTLSFTEPVGPDAVLFVHGFGGAHDGDKARALSSACAERGWTWAGFDFRGHGLSGGTLLELSGSGLLDDLEVVLRFLGERGVRRLFLVGSSMGGWASAWFTTRHPEVVRACVGVAPALDFVSRRWSGLSEEERRAWQQTGRLRIFSRWLDPAPEVGPGLLQERDSFPLSSLVAGWRTPFLIFHGLLDDVVPFEDSLALARLAPGRCVELRLYSDGDHRLLAYKDEMAQEACRFFARWWGRD